MSEEARRWREDHEEGKRLMEGAEQDLDRAYELLARSARNFPDSPFAREAHLLRAAILDASRRGNEGGSAAGPGVLRGEGAGLVEAGRRGVG
jgi:hypothetical protein